MGGLRTAVWSAAGALVGAALAGLPPVRDGLDRVSARAWRAWSAPRWSDVARAVRWYADDRRLASRYASGRYAAAWTDRIVRARVAALTPRERAVYAECSRREVARLRPGTQTSRDPITGVITIPIRPSAR